MSTPRIVVQHEKESTKPLPLLLWVCVLLPLSMVFADLFWPLVFGQPSMILTYFGVHIGWGC